jgi:hypothetical protein
VTVCTVGGRATPAARQARPGWRRAWVPSGGGSGRRPARFRFRSANRARQGPATLTIWLGYISDQTARSSRSAAAAALGGALCAAHARAGGGARGLASSRFCSTTARTPAPAPMRRTDTASKTARSPGDPRAGPTSPSLAGAPGRRCAGSRQINPPGRLLFAEIHCSPWCVRTCTTGSGKAMKIRKNMARHILKEPQRALLD